MGERGNEVQYHRQQFEDFVEPVSGGAAAEIETPDSCSTAARSRMPGRGIKAEALA
jgi:hypothetical protein